MARLSRVTKEFNLGLDTIVDFLEKNNLKVERDMNAKITDDMYDLLKKEFQPDADEKQKTKEVDLSETRKVKETVSLPVEETVEQKQEEIFEPSKVELEGPKVVGEVKLANEKPATDKKASVFEPTVEKNPIVEKVETIEKPKKVEKIQKVEEVQEIEVKEETPEAELEAPVEEFIDTTEGESPVVEEEMMSLKTPKISG